MANNNQLAHRKVTDYLELPQKVLEYCTFNTLIEVQFNDLVWRGKDRSNQRKGPACTCCDGLKYYKADIRYPGIVFKRNNPNRPETYFAYDGAHRIEKMKDQGIKSALFFEFPSELGMSQYAQFNNLL